MEPEESSDSEKQYFPRLAELEAYYLSSLSAGQTADDNTSKFYQLLGQFTSSSAPKTSSAQSPPLHQSPETPSYQETFHNMAGAMTTYIPEEYYPEGKIYDLFGKYVSSYQEDSRWHDNLSSALEMMEGKLHSPRIKKLEPLWYSVFEDRELKKLERSLLAIRIVVDDILREEKELKLWRIQHRHLKDILCQVDDIVDDIALRAPQLTQLFQSHQVSQHPYLTDKLVQINNLIQELGTITAEIKSVVLPEFNTRIRKTPGPTFHGNQPTAMSLQAPSGNNRKNPMVSNKEDPVTNPSTNDMRLFYAVVPPHSSQGPTTFSFGKDEFMGEHLAFTGASRQDFKTKNNRDESYNITSKSEEENARRYDKGVSNVFHSASNEGNARRRNENKAESKDLTSEKKEEEPRRSNSVESDKPLIYGEEPLAISLTEISLSNPITSLEILPKHLKRCLFYTSLFPRNFEFEKNMLVQMWIAVGYIRREENKLLEETAGRYFDELLSMSIFQVSQLDSSRYILEDDVYKLLQDSAAGDCARLEDGNLNGISRETLHSSVLYESSIDPMIFKSFNKLKGLHTLLLLHNSRKHIKHIPSDLITSLRCIRVLDLSGTQMKEVPISIGDIKTLHYLDLSGTHIKSLPQSICSLSSLQSLKLQGCFNLVELPKNMKNLISLRHLELDITRQLTFMPPKLGKLTNLQTLSAFIAEKGSGRQLAELKNMVYLRGSLRILKLENVLTVEDAEEAALYDKDYLHKLELQWSVPCLQAINVLEGLEPSRNIAELEIVCYGGLNFPTWFGDSSFSKLTSINIYKCKDCTTLPLLGRLPSLKSLRIAEMQALQKIDQQFCGGGRGKGFSKLEILEIDGMPLLEEWTGVQENGMACLRKLTIVDCPSLVKLPELSNLKSLQHLEISLCFKLPSLPAEKRLPSPLQTLIITDCPKLKESCRKDGVDWHKIADVPAIWIDYQHIS